MSVEQSGAGTLGDQGEESLQSPQWWELSEQEIFPHTLPPYGPFIQMCRELYGPGLSPADYVKMRAALMATHLLNRINHTRPVRGLRRMLGISLPEPSVIDRNHSPDQQEKVFPRPWELYLTKTRKADRRVGVSNNIQYQTDHPDFIPELTLALVNSQVFSTDAYHSYLQHVIDSSVPARLPYRKKEKLFAESPNGRSVSILHIQKDGSCTYMERPVMQTLPTGELQPVQDVSSYHFAHLEFVSWEEFQKSNIRDVQVIINESNHIRKQAEKPRPEDILDPKRPYHKNRGRSFRKSSLVLMESAAIAVDIFENGEVDFSFDHLAGDGRPVAGLVCEISDKLERFESGFLDRPGVDLLHGARIEFHSEPHELRQSFALEGLPEGMTFTDLNLALLMTLHEVPGTAFSDYDDVGNLRPEAVLENKTVSGTATADYPVPITRDTAQRQLAQETNRINVFGNSTQQHARLINHILSLKGMLTSEYGLNWLGTLEKANPQLVRNMFPEEYAVVYRDEHLEMRARLKEYIAQARKDRNTMQLAQLFYGVDMDQALGDAVEHVMPDDVVSKMHAHAVLTMIELNRMRRPEALPHLETIVPKGLYGAGGKVEFGIVTMRPHTIREDAIAEARAQGHQGTDEEIWLSTVMERFIPQMIGQGINDEQASRLMRQFDRLSQFATLAETHTLSWEDTDPDLARTRGFHFSAKLMQNIFLIHHLNRGFLSS